MAARKRPDDEERVVLLQKYSNICSAAGDEDTMRSCIRDEIKDFADELKVNPLGNLTAVRHGNNPDVTLLITAHMDEVAFIVKSIEKSGLIKFYTVGGLIPKILVGNSIVVGKNRKPGVIAYKSYHLMTPQEKKKIPEKKELFIDVGAGSSEEVRDIGPGDYAYFKSEFFSQDDYYFGKAFDDRAGCAALTEVLKDFGKDRKPEPTVFATFTVQEEVGLRGGATAAFGLKHVLFNLNLEGTTCSDRELKSTYSPVTVSGGGPAITFMDRTTITQRRLFDFVRSVAEKYGIPYQLKRSVAGGTDAGATHLTGEGVPAVTVSVPVRYIHSPWGIINRHDFDHYVTLGKMIVSEALNYKPG